MDFLKKKDLLMDSSCSQACMHMQRERAYTPCREQTVVPSGFRASMHSIHFGYGPRILFGLWSLDFGLCNAILQPGTSQCKFSPRSGSSCRSKAGTRAGCRLLLASVPLISASWYSATADAWSMGSEKAGRSSYRWRLLAASYC